MKQLSGIDATFLYMETPETPMHVAGLTLYEPPKALEGSFYDHFRKFFASRLHLIPIFGQKLARAAFDLDHPGWVEVEDIDLDYHLRHLHLPKPGTFAQLEAMVGDLHSVLLDRSRPLWQFTVIEGLADGRLAVYSKVHHAAVDGGAGMVITKALYDLTEVPRDVGPAPERKRAPRPNAQQKALVGLNDLVANMVRQHITVATAGAKLLNAMANLANPFAPSAGEAPKGPRPLPDLLPPKTPFNGTISGQRSYAARSVSLKDAKFIAKATGTKLNDVVMALCATVLRNYLLAKKALPSTPLIAFVPISLREAGNTDINNQVFGMNCPLATDIPDPLERLLEIQRGSGASKTMAGVMKEAAPRDYTLIGAPLLLPGLMQMLGKSGLADVVPMGVNVVISNTQGPPYPLYGGGAKVLALYPVSIPTHGIGLNLTVQSYLDHLDFGLTADRKSVPDVAAMADGLQPALDELMAAVKAKMPAPKPETKPEAKAESVAAEPAAPAPAKPPAGTAASAAAPKASAKKGASKAATASQAGTAPKSDKGKKAAAPKAKTTGNTPKA